MDKDKKFVGGWFFWILFLLIVGGIILAGLNAVGLIGKTFVKRKVFEQSYQKQEADKTGITVYSAQLAQLRGKLNNPNISAGQKAEIRAQIDAINILKAGKED